ncbi:MAG: class I SAM-dependent methyltransferase [Planctomycetota bacterium]
MSASHQYPSETATVAVAYDRPRQRERAEALAMRLNLPTAQRLADPHDLHLTVASRPKLCDRLELRVNDYLHRKPPLGGGNPVAAEPHLLDVTSPAGRKLNAPLFKAVGIRKGNLHRPHVLDATAGFGEDAWLLAAAGCTVTAYERNPIIHALLEDALRRAADTQPETASRITLHHANLLVPGTRLTNHPPEVIYLDPMFPLGRKTTEKKPMRLLRWIIGNDDDATALAAIAMKHATRRVVEKLPPHVARTVAYAPTYIHGDKAVRYHMYAIPNAI